MDIKQLFLKYWPGFLVILQNSAFIGVLSIFKNIPPSYLITAHSLVIAVNGVYLTQSKNASQSAQNISFLQNVTKRILTGKNGEISTLSGVVFNDLTYNDNTTITTSPIIKYDPETKIYTALDGVLYKVFGQASQPVQPAKV